MEFEDICGFRMSFATNSNQVSPDSGSSPPNPIRVQVTRGRRGDRGRDRRRPERDARPPEDNMTRYRVEVGHRDRVKPGNLVGAIANESGLQGRMIGRIQIFESHSLVDLPKGMPDDVFDSLQRLKVLNRELQITKAS